MLQSRYQRCFKLTKQATRYSSRSHLRYPSLLAQGTLVLLPIGRLLTRYLAVQLEAIMVAYRRFVVCAQVGKAEELDRACAGYCGFGVVAHRGQNRELD